MGILWFIEAGCLGLLDRPTAVFFDSARFFVKTDALNL